MSHLTSYHMYVMRLDTTLYACDVGRHHGRHIKIQMFHSRRHLNTKYYSRLR